MFNNIFLCELVGDYVDCMMLQGYLIVLPVQCVDEQT